MSQQINTADNPGIGYAAQLRLQVSQLTAGSPFFLKAIEIDFAAAMDWDLIPGQVKLTNLGLQLAVTRDQPDGAWQTAFHFDSVLALGDQVVDAHATLQVGSAHGSSSSLTLGIEATSGGKRQALALLAKFAATGSSSDDALETLIRKDTPPSVNDGLERSGGSDAFSARLSLRKDTKGGKGWFLDHARVDLVLQQMYWHPFADADTQGNLYLDNLFLTLSAGRTGRPRETPLDYRVIFGGTLVIFGLPVQTTVSYASLSATRIIGLDCAIADRGRISLDQMARHPLLNPSPQSKTLDLPAAASARPLPASAPVSLTWCDLPDYGRSRFCSLTFVDNKLTRARLAASMGVPWDLAPWLRIENMGLYFDIAYPQPPQGQPIPTPPPPPPPPSPPNIVGYAYGTLSLQKKLNLFAFVAGVQKSTTLRHFLLHLSLTTQPESVSGSPLGVKPADVFSLLDPRFSENKIDDQDKNTWSHPDSFPADATPPSTLASLSASMDIAVSQKQNAGNNNRFDTQIQAIRASLALSGSASGGGWEIFSGVKLTGLAMRVLAIPLPKKKKKPDGDDEQMMLYRAQLEGIVSADLSRLPGGSGGEYVVRLAAVMQRVNDMTPLEVTRQKTEFTASATIYPASSPGVTGEEASLLTLLRLPVTGGTDPSTDDKVKDTIPSQVPIKPEDMLAATPGVAECALHVSRGHGPNGVWDLNKITATYAQSAGKEWRIWDDKIVFTNSRLLLSIDKPRDPDKRRIRFLASATIRIGGLDTELSATVARGQTQDAGAAKKTDTLVVRIETGMPTVSDVVHELIGAHFSFPETAPSMESSNGFDAWVEVVFVAKTDGLVPVYDLASVEAGGTWLPSTTWTLGPFTLGRLSLSAKAVGINSVSKRKTTVTFIGRATVNDNLQLTLAVEYNSADSVLTVVAAAGSGLSPSTAVSLCGNKRGLTEGGNAPPVSVDMGLSGYTTNSINAEVRILFALGAGSNSQWLATSLSATVSSQTQNWVLVRDVLHATDLSLSLEVAKLASEHPDVSVAVRANFKYKTDDGDVGMSGRMQLALVAEMTQMRAELITDTCNLPSFLYVATAGFLKVPAWLDLPIVRLNEVEFTLNWDQGWGTIAVILDDWKLPKSLPDIASMKKPQLRAKIDRQGGRLGATGSLAGTAV